MAMDWAPVEECRDGVDNDGDGYIDYPADTDCTSLYHTPEAPAYVDNDGDGYNSDVDCNDNDASVHPGAFELCNGVDDDCSMDTADGVDESWYNQPTSCGLGECYSTGMYTCQEGMQYNTCVEGTPEPEICDGLDNNCDG